jgi:hypothetical protein
MDVARLGIALVENVDLFGRQDYGPLFAEHKHHADLDLDGAANSS